MIQGSLQLGATAADMTLDTQDPDLGVVADELSRLEYFLLVGQDLTRQDHGLGFVPRWSKILLDQQDIYPPLQSSSRACDFVAPGTG